MKQQNMKRIHTIALLALISLAVAGCKTQDDTHPSSSAASNGSYPLTKCVVSGEDLGDKPYTFVHNGQTVKLCCKDCLAKFNQEPEKYMAKISQAK